MNTYSKLIIILLFVVVQPIAAQQDAQYTQYLYNTISVNPAYAGSRETLSIGALHRAQWVGLDGAPSTQSFNIHSPVSERVGLGLSVINDEIGNNTVQETYFDAIFSYTIPVSYKGSLAFGIKAGGQLFNLNFGQLRVFDPSMPVAQPNIDNKFSPNFGVGAYYYTDTFYTGISAPNVLETEFFDTTDSASGNTTLATERINYYWIMGYVFDLDRGLKFKPASLVKAVNGAPLQVDLSANFLYREKFSFGAAYRWSAAVSALIGYQLSDQLLVGMSYDRETTALGATTFNDGSFEIFLRYDFISRIGKAVTPRFF